MDLPKLPRRLLATFLGEMEERIGALNKDLLALEQASDDAARAEVLKLLFRSAHSLKGAAGAIGVGAVEAACHELEDLFDGLGSGQLNLDAALMQRLFASADALQRLGNQLRAQIDGAEAPSRPAPTPAAPTPATPVPAPLPAAEPEPAGPAPTRFARIPVDRLDTLLLRSGELLIARNRAAARLEEATRLGDVLAQARSLRRQAAGQEGEQYLLSRLVKDVERLVGALATDSRELDRAASPLDGEIRNLRLLPFAEACAGLDRAVRDIAVSGGKEVQLRIEGGEVELDRSLVDRLKAPLLHLVRNAADHGIEPAVARLARGKPGPGTITVAARLRGASVEITVADDGGGLDLAAVREQARRSGLPEAAPDDLLQYIFLPRFSTARTTTEISGRGVGLDAVKGEIEAMRGTIEAAAQPGRGMRFAMVLPLTLSTIRALLVEAGGQVFAVDAASIIQLLRVEPETLRLVEGQRAVALPDGLVPLVALSRVLGLRVAPPAAGARLTVVLLGAGQKRLALEVEGLLGEQEAVVRSLGPRLVRVRNFIGGTLLPTGRIALILNPASIIQAALAEGRTVAAAAAGAAAPPRRVLLVDDSVTTRALERSALEVAGFAVTTAANGAEAWQLLLESGADVVVTDVDMPVMDGFQLVETIRSSSRFSTLPVILVTARESQADRERGLAIGANAYVLKSTFDRRVLADTINELI